LGDHQIPRGPDRSDAIGQKQREDFIARHMGEVQHVGDVRVSIDQTGDQEPAASIDDPRVPRRADRAFGRTDALDAFALNDYSAPR